MTTVHYTVPLAGEDLTPGETVRQLCDSLAHLDAVVDDVFSRIETRVDRCHRSIAGFDARLDVSKAKIDAIRGSTKALKVFSSAKYPGDISDSVYSDYRSIYADVDLEIPSTDESPHRYQGDTMSMSHEDMIKEKIRYYTVPALSEHKEHEFDEGLGSLPDDINTLGSLYLFNTSENLYNEYVYLDPLGVEVRTRTSEVSEPLAAAPDTITNRDPATAVSGRTDDFTFVPEIGDVPAIEMPDFLPELVGIADDLIYEKKVHIESIAPSVPMSPSNPPPPPPPSTDEPPSAEQRPSSSTAGPPPPPPPPPVEEPATTAVTTPPPPPAPPTPPTPQPAAKEEAKTSKKKKKKSAQPKEKTIANGMSDLLASIRSAGGAKGGKLSKTKARKTAKSAAIVTEPSLIDDLTAKLTLRRIGISGEKKKKVEPLCRLSSMIPEPPLCDVEDPANSPDWD